LRRAVIAFVFVLGLALLCVPRSLANVTVTAATGGTNISADKAQNAISPAFTTIGNIIIVEGANNDFGGANLSSVTLILTAPSGWTFNPGVGSATAANGNDLTINGISVTTTNITITYSTDGSANKIDSLTISGIQVLAVNGQPVEDPTLALAA